MNVKIETLDGPRNVWVCDYCRTVYIPPPQRFCSGHCARNYEEARKVQHETPSGMAVSGTKAKDVENDTMTDLEEAISRLTAWARDKRHELRPVFLDDMACVISYAKLNAAVLDDTANKLSSVWLFLDAHARHEADLTPEVAAEILRKQQAPGWKT